ncbi:MAG: DALR domain-containing protein, partial [Thermoplasmatota archaeon]
PGEPAWPSPWGEGRPGWHIECSTMSTRYLGAPFDIHGGGHDLVFPHHENEIAQAEAGLQEQFARYWLHSGMLNVDGEKMSKSLGNFVTIREALERWDAETLRFFFASYHYRSPADFSRENMEMARRRLERIHRLRDDLQQAAADAEIDETGLDDRSRAYLEAIQAYRERFEAAMDDDFNTPEAIAALFDFMRESNRYLADGQPDGALCNHALQTLLEAGRVLTLFQEERREVDVQAVASLAKKYGGAGEGSLDDVMDELLDIRAQARRDKDYEMADAIRDDLEELGFEVQDTDDGAKWRIA